MMLMEESKTLAACVLLATMSLLLTGQFVRASDVPRVETGSYILDGEEVISHRELVEIGLEGFGGLRGVAETAFGDDNYREAKEKLDEAETTYAQTEAEIQELEDRSKGSWPDGLLSWKWLLIMGGIGTVVTVVIIAAFYLRKRRGSEIKFQEIEYRPIKGEEEPEGIWQRLKRKFER